MSGGPAGDERRETLQRLYEYEAEFEAQSAALREAYDALARSRDRFRQLFEEAPVAFVVLDAKAVVRQVNRRAVDLLDRDADRLVGRPLMGRIHAVHHSPLRAHLDLILHARRAGPCTVRLAGGGSRHVRLDSGPLERDGEQLVLTSLVDVTEQRRSEDAVRTSEARFRALFEASVDAFALLDGASLSVRELNSAFVRLTGMEPESLLGRRVRGLFPDEQRWAVSATLREALHHGHAGPLAVTLHPPGHPEPRRVELYATGVRAGGGLFAMVGLRDVHENWLAVQRRRAVERQLWQVQKVEMIGALASGAAVDLGNVLGTIQALVARLDGGGPIDPDTRRTLERAFERGRALVHGLQGLPRDRSAGEDVVALHSIVEDARGLLQRVKPDGVTIEVDVHERAQVRGDPARLAQAAFNLLANAVHAVGLEGRVRVVGCVEELPEGAVGQLPAGRYVRLSVEDDGPGMLPDVLARAFDAFFTTKGSERGTGLGLAMVRTTVEDHDGHVELDSQVGQGTTATLWLPLDSTEVDESDVVSTAARRTLHLLVVDDDPLVLRATSRMLRAAGYRVTPAGGGRAALELIDAHPDIDVALVDLTMPDIEGPSLMRRLLARPAPPRLLAMTGFIAAELPEDLSGQILALLRKPFDGDDVRRALADLQQPDPDSEPG